MKNIVFPKRQRVIRNFMYFLSGILGLNGFIESVNNSIGMPSKVTLVLVIVLALVWAMAELTLRKGAQRWVLKSGNSVSIKKLGVWPRLACAGALSLLLIPKLIVFIGQREGDKQLKSPSAQASSTQSLQSSTGLPLSDDSSIQFIGSYIEPRHFFFNEPSTGNNSYEVVALYFSVKNFSDKPLMLTSMDVSLTGGEDARLTDSGGSRGIEILGQDPNKNKPTIIEPGEVKTVSYEHGLYLPGIASFFLQESNKWKPIVLVPYGRHTIASTHPLSWASALRDELSRRYGDDLKLRVNLYSNFKRLVKTFEVKLAQVEIAPDGKGDVDYDFFVGNALLQLAQANAIKATVVPPVDWESLERRRRRAASKSRQPSNATVLYSIETLAGGGG